MKHVLNIAHRGFTRDFPDNTLESFKAAIGIPVDAIECDVRETADGHFVIFHDAELSGQDIGVCHYPKSRRPGFVTGSEYRPWKKPWTCATTGSG